MDYPELAQIDMDDYREVGNPARGRARAKMILHAAAFIAIATVGFLIGGVSGAVTVIVWWAGALIVGKRLRTNKVQAPAGPAERPQAS